MTDATGSKVKELAAFIEDRGSKERAFREHDSVPAKLMAEVLKVKLMQLDNRNKIYYHNWESDFQCLLPKKRPLVTTPNIQGRSIDLSI